MKIPVSELKQIAQKIRRKFLAMHYQAKAGHIGSGLSAIEILTCLYWDCLEPRDTFILSKGHAASALYAALYVKGIFSEETINSYYKDGTSLPAHPAALLHKPWIALASGSLGHGLPVSNGLAYAGRYLKKDQGRTICLISDGECDEGSVWEAALFAGHHKLDNLTVLIDANGLQGFGATREVMGLEPLAKKWEAFQFHVEEVDGHDIKAIGAAIAAGKNHSDSPHCVICRTVKGKGVSFMENKMEWHYLPMSPEQYEKAVKELDQTP